jgi:hypothetical protein
MGRRVSHALVERRACANRCACSDVWLLHSGELVGVVEEMSDNRDDMDMTEEEWEAQQMEEKMRMNRDDREMKGYQRK